MDQATWLGALCGLVAAAVQNLHVARAIRKQLHSARVAPIRKALVGSMARLGFLVALFVGAALWDGVRIEAAIIAFAAAHLIGMLWLGARLARGSFEPADRR